MYGAAIACYFVVNLVDAAVSHGTSLANIAGAVVVAASLFGLLAAFAPRTAVCVLVVTTVLGTWNLFWIGIDNGWWRVVLVPVNLFAVYLAVRAYPLAATYVNERKRRTASARGREEMARDYERQQPW
jgi:hypothetical protein